MVMVHSSIGRPRSPYTVLPFPELLPWDLWKVTPCWVCSQRSPSPAGEMPQTPVPSSWPWMSPGTWRFSFSLEKKKMCNLICLLFSNCCSWIAVPCPLGLATGNQDLYSASGCPKKTLLAESRWLWVWVTAAPLRKERDNSGVSGNSSNPHSCKVFPGLKFKMPVGNTELLMMGWGLEVSSVPWLYTTRLEAF